jgi:glucokinase
MPIACIGAGTGLGECYLTPHDGQWAAWASEGGHAEFAPRNELEVLSSSVLPKFELTRTLCAQIELLQFLKEKFHEKNRVSVERVVSGPGLVSVYEFLKQHRDWKGKIDPKIDAEFQGVEYASYEPLP